MTTTLKFIAAAIFTVLVGVSVGANAAEIPGEGDLALAIQSTAVAQQQLQRAIQLYGPAFEAVKKQAEKATYWEDACRSTPSCGGDTPAPAASHKP